MCFLYIKITVEEWPITLPKGHKIELTFYVEKMRYAIYRVPSICLDWALQKPGHTPKYSPSWVVIYLF